MHFLIYGKGFQTWEYSPEYALRSYLYVLVHALPGWVYNALLSPNPMYIFYSLRCMMAVACSLAELYFFKGIVKEVMSLAGFKKWSAAIRPRQQRAPQSDFGII